MVGCWTYSVHRVMYFFSNMEFDIHRTIVCINFLIPVVFYVQGVHLALVLFQK